MFTACSTNECIVWINLKHNSFCLFVGREISSFVVFIFLPLIHLILVILANVDYFNILQEQITQHAHQGDIFICRDLNARTGQLQDNISNVMGRDGNLESLTYNEISSVSNITIGYKSSQDMSVNRYGRSLLAFCKATSFRIMNGRIYNDKNIGEFTYESDLGRSVIDLLICKLEDMTLITDFSILPMHAYHRV